MKVEREMKLSELAQRSGVPARTIRLYISKGVLNGPLRAGRDAAYGAEHLEGLRRIRELQSEGLTLGEIRLALNSDRREASLPRPVPWWSYSVAPDVTVLVRGDVSGWRMRQVQKALSAMGESLNAGSAEESDNDGNE